jgi:3-phenylpropionate/cinnamic acid dioxygenase small subunit
MNADEAHRIAADLLYREALYLDERRWDEWLALYDAHPEFWVPAWRTDDTPTADPSSEVSLLYIATHMELAERVARVRSGKSAASTPLPRTAHIVSNVLAEPDAEAIIARSIITTQIFNIPRREQYFSFTRCEHRLVRVDDAWRIKRKKMLLVNDYIPTLMDFYTI